MFFKHKILSNNNNIIIIIIKIIYSTEFYDNFMTFKTSMNINVGKSPLCPRANNDKYNQLF
jgi:hypothetical protein